MLLALSVVSLVPAATARASGAIVPWTHPTIQAAIDSGVDTVYVRSGDYDEDLVIAGDLVLMAYPTQDFGVSHLVRARGLAYLDVGFGYRFAVIGLGFRGPANLLGSATVRLHGCRFDSSLVLDGRFQYTSMLGCQVFGGITGQPYSLDVTNSTIVGGGISVGFEGNLSIRSNYVVGPAAIGIEVWDGDGGADVSHNTVIAAGEGIVMHYPIGSSVHGNRILDCAGNGIRCDHPGGGSGGTAYIDGNDIRRCGGHGVELVKGSYRVSSNTIDSVGQCGIHASYPTMPQYASKTGNRISAAGSHGLWVEGHVGVVRGNRVLGAAGDGIRLAAADSVELNVTGRCGGAGLVSAAPEFDPMVLARNTMYLNAGAGIVVTSRGAETVRANIAHGNLGHGLAWSGSGAPTLGCNDWSGNVAGTVSPGSAGATDVAVNPLFCDLPADDVTLSAGSPLLALAGSCGPIGALGVGCASALDVPGARSGPTGLSASPSPARAGVRFAFGPLAQPGRIDVFDVRGARRWGADVPAGAAALEWDGAGDDGSPLPAGVYFARVLFQGCVLDARVVLVR
jgi:hypothetical protein